MASKHFVPILLLLIFLAPHIGYGAIYRFHDLNLHNYKGLKNNNHPQKMGGPIASPSSHNMANFDYPMFASVPKASPKASRKASRKASPIPPSGPSHRHNQHIDSDPPHNGSAKAPDKVLS
ncbi:hypothetical protein FH972_016121 [Carpinus fangiana]|uniref:Transmembrane protein n=1 Tax=Carpinus fangiana TaxID=176857 RepID=A0A5N6RGY0_9ROSI|nr:hypothetical protein FH972_016121 [Carpinus fangiana]